MPDPIAEGLRANSGGWAYYAASQTGSLVYSGPVVDDFTFTWVERDGTPRDIEADWEVQGHPAFSSLSLSPDGARLALSELTEDGWTLWVKQLEPLGPFSKLTSGGFFNFRATWSSNGDSVTFVSIRRENFDNDDVFTQRWDGSGTADLVLDRESNIAEALYSPDRTWLVYREGDVRDGVSDIYASRTEGDTTSVPLVATDDQEYSPAVSPHGRWLAYVSERTGRPEVYVSPFPDGISGGRLPVSSPGT